MAEPVRVGVVGAGTMGGSYARVISETPVKYRAKVVAVCDSDGGRARGLADAVHAHPYTELENMLCSEFLDAVYLAVPDPAHRVPALACIDAGVAVLVEKPLATTVADADEIVRAARRAGVLVEVNFSNRWNPPFRRAHEAITAGEIGDVVGINARLSNTLTVPRSMAWASSTTAGWFLLSHVLDLATWMVGAPAESILALGHDGVLAGEGIDTYDLIHSSIRYVGGASGIYEASWMLPVSLPSPVDFAFRIAGTKGAVGIDTTHQTIVVANEETMSYPSVLDWAQQRLHAFFDRLDGGPPDGDLLEAGLENTRQLVALHESLDVGAPIIVHPKGKSA